VKFSEMVEQYLDVRQHQGVEWLALCPFHNDHSPSFRINVEKEVYICFSCGAQGSGIKLAEYLKAGKLDTGVTEDTMARAVAELEVETEEARPVPEAWLNQFDHDHAYWKRRGFSPDTIATFRLGFDPLTNCVTIPIRTLKREPLGVVRRRLDDQRPKYIYPKGLPISRSLFGAWDAQDHPWLAICEGPLDAIAMWDAGVPAVAMYGSRISDAQARLLRIMGTRGLVIATDNDEAGLRARDRIVETMPDLSLKLLTYPQGSLAKDPGELSRIERREAYTGAQPWVDWVLDQTVLR